MTLAWQRERLGVRMKVSDRGIWIVMAENLPKICSVGGHCFRSGLAQPHAMALSDPFHNDQAIFLLQAEIVTGNCVPAEAACSAQASRLVGTA